MRAILMLASLGLALLACSPKANTTGLGGGGDVQVDQASYNSLVNVKWCQPTPVGLNYFFSWKFSENKFAEQKKTDSNTKQDVTTTQKSWVLQGKTLYVREPNSMTEIFHRDISFFYDANTGVKQMLWTEIVQSTCTNGVCTTPAANVMTLTECE